MVFTTERRIKADNQKVWQLISDLSSSPGHGVEVLVVDPGKKNGIGMVRDITIGKMRIRERIEEIEAGKSFTYSIIQGTPTRSYKGKAQIAKLGDETSLTWSGDFVPKIPLTGPVIRMVAKKNVSKYIDAVLSNLAA